MSDNFKKQPHHLIYEGLLQQGITLGIITKEDGLSDYPKNAFNMVKRIDDRPYNITQHQLQLAEEIVFDRRDWVSPTQTYENKVACTTENDIGTNIDILTDVPHGIDAVYTHDSNVLLAMCYADCVPVYFYSTRHHFIALTYAGWRGTYTEIVKEVLKHANFDLKNLHIVIGPSTPSSYEIDDGIKNRFEALPIDNTNCTEIRGRDRHGIDLKKASTTLLIYHGIPRENIYTTTYTTSEYLELLFSYRLEKGQTGRMLTFIDQQQTRKRYVHV